MIRQQHTIKMRFSPGGPKYTVQWYFCPPGALPLPFPTAFVNGIWETSVLSPNLGEDWPNFSYHTTPFYVPPITALGNGHICGTPEQFANGFPVGTFTDVPYNSENIPSCCGNDALLWGGGMSDSSAIFTQPVRVLLTSGSNFSPMHPLPLTIPAGVSGTLVVIVGNVSSTGLPCVVTSAQAGILTATQTAPGPSGATFALSTIALYSYQVAAGSDTITFSGIPGGGLVMASAIWISGGIGSLIVSAQATGSAEPMLLPIPGSVGGAALIAGQLYASLGGTQGWVAPFLRCSASTAPDVVINYDAINYAIDTGYYPASPGAPITAQDGPSGTVWAAVGGAWV
jgi:hypothetical protein